MYAESEINVQAYIKDHPELFGNRIGRETHSRGGEQAVCKCPFCHRPAKFYIAVDSGLWDCKVCGEKGNFFTLQKAFGHATIRPRHTSRYVSSDQLYEPTKVAPRVPDPGIDDRHHNDLMARKTDDAKSAWDWLTSVRKFSESIIVEFKLGVARLDCMGDDKIRDKMESIKSSIGGRVLSRGKRKGLSVSHKDHGEGPNGECAMCGGTGDGLYVSLPFYLDGKLVGMKYRAIPPTPKHWRRIPGCESTLYHFDKLIIDDEESPLILVEGEWDVIAMREMGYLNVTSLQTGASGNLSDKWLARVAEVKSIMICYDMDQAGKDGAERIATALGRDRCYFVSLPCKDANDCLIQNKQKDVASAFETAEGWRPTMIRESGELFKSIWDDINDPERHYGYSTGYDSLDALLAGIRPHETTIFTGHSGSGKSTFALDLMRHLLAGDHPGLIAPFELQTKPSLKKMIRMTAGCDLGTDEGKKKFWPSCDLVKEWPLYWLDHYGSISLQTLKESIYYSVSRLGVEWVLLDHLDFFLEIKGNEKEWEASQRTMKELEAWVQDLPFHLFLVVHPKNNNDDETCLVQMNDLKGGSVTRQVAHNIVSIHRKRTKTRIVKVKPKVNIFVLKCRNDVGTEGMVEFAFEPNSTTYIDEMDLDMEDYDAEAAETEF